MNALGLYDLNRNVRAVGRAYKDLIAAWRAVLPTQSVCLSVPIGPIARDTNEEKFHAGRAGTYSPANADH